MLMSNQHPCGGSALTRCRKGPAEFAAPVAYAIANPMLNGEVIRSDDALRMPPK